MHCFCCLAEASQLHVAQEEELFLRVPWFYCGLVKVKLLACSGCFTGLMPKHKWKWRRLDCSQMADSSLKHRVCASHNWRFNVACSTSMCNPVETMNDAYIKVSEDNSLMWFEYSIAVR